MRLIRSLPLFHERVFCAVCVPELERSTDNETAVGGELEERYLVVDLMVCSLGLNIRGNAVNAGYNSRVLNQMSVCRPCLCGDSDIAGFFRLQGVNGNLDSAACYPHTCTRR